MSYRVSLLFAGVAILNALLFAARTDWTTAGLSVLAASCFAVMGARKLKKRTDA